MIKNSEEDIKVSLSDEELKKVIAKMQKIIKEGEYTEDWTYSSGNRKNKLFRETYICGEDEYRDVMLRLKPDCFYEAEKNNSPRAQRDPEAAKEIMYKFIIKETFHLRDDEVTKELDLYIKFDFPAPEFGDVVIVSFHESERSLEEQREYDKNKGKDQK